MDRLRRAWRRRFGNRDVPDFDDEELMLEEDKLDELAEEHAERDMKTDESMEIPSFDYHPRDGLTLN